MVRKVVRAGDLETPRCLRADDIRTNLPHIQYPPGTTGCGSGFSGRCRSRVRRGHDPGGYAPKSQGRSVSDKASDRPPAPGGAFAQAEKGARWVPSATVVSARNRTGNIRCMV